MDPPPSARAATQAVEARPQGLRGNAPTRTVTVGGRSGRLPRTTLVASRRQASSGRPYHPLLRPTGSAQTCRLTSTFRTAGCGPACPVVWQGSSGAPLPPMPIVPSMTRDLEVKVLCASRPQRALAKRKVVSREAVAERSAEQNREPTNRNRIQGVVVQGERAEDRKALTAKEPLRKSGGCAVKVTESYLGRSRLMPERATRRSGARSQPRP